MQSNSAPTLHIVFNPSSAASLRDALRECGRDERVISIMDSLNFGPINPPDPAIRNQWVEEELGYSGWDDISKASASFWVEALSANCQKVAWTSRRSAQEHAGFLEWLSRIGAEPFEFVDLTDVKVTNRHKTGEQMPPQLAISLALLHAHQILESGLLDSSRTIGATLRDQYEKQWARLRAENAPFRIFTEHGLQSAPMTVFDSLLMSHVTHQWRKAALVVGKALADFYDASLLQTDDLVLAARVRALVEIGQLEARGDLFHIRASEVRRPKRQET